MIQLETAEVSNDNFLQCSEASTRQTENQGKEVISNYSPPFKYYRYLARSQGTSIPHCIHNHNGCPVKKVKPSFTQVKSSFTQVKSSFTQVKSSFTQVKSSFTTYINNNTNNNTNSNKNNNNNNNNNNLFIHPQDKCNHQEHTQDKYNQDHLENVFTHFTSSPGNDHQDCLFKEPSSYRRSSGHLSDNERKEEDERLLQRHMQKEQYFTPLVRPAGEEELILDSFKLESGSKQEAKEVEDLLEKQHLRLIGSWRKKLQVECEYEHKSIVDVEHLEKRLGCGKCQLLAQHVDQTVQGLGGRLLHGHQVFRPVFKVQCKEGHEFVANYKTVARKWCSICKKVNNSYQKMAEQQARHAQQTQKHEREQQEMFNQSKHNFFNSPSTPEPLLNQHQVLYAFKETEKEIEQLADNYATNQHNYQDAFYVYKILLLSEDILKLYFQALDQNELKLEYKRYAKRIHPDKNQHDKSGIAFRKLKDLYNQTLLK